MYKLILTSGERKAIDWIGDRYAHGDDLISALSGLEVSGDNGLVAMEDVEWSGDYDIEFAIPEHAAWKINTIGEKSFFRWDCFADSLARKLTKFCMDIV